MPDPGVTRPRLSLTQLADIARRVDADTVACTTVGLGVIIVGAPVVGSTVVALASLVWLLIALAWATRTCARLTRERRIVALWCTVGVLPPMVRMVSLGLLQTIGGRTALYWSPDWRGAASQARTVARFGGIRNSLDFAGEKLNYHIGPAWIAGGLRRLLGIPVNTTLFIVVPALSVLVVAVSLYRLLVRVGASSSVAMAAVAVTLNIPRNPIAAVKASVASLSLRPLLSTDSSWISPRLMLNSLFALAVGTAALSIAIKLRSRWEAVLAGVGLGALLALKPQYLVGVCGVALIGLTAVALRRRPRALAPLAVLAGGLAAGAALAGLVAASNVEFTGVALNPLSRTLRSMVTSQNLFAIAAIVIAVHLVVRRLRADTPSSMVVLAGGSLVGAIALRVTVEATTFLIDPTQIAQARAIGLDITRSSADFDFDQVLLPVTLMLVAFAWVLVHTLAERSGRTARRAVGATAITCVVLSLPLTVDPLVHPMGSATVGASEESELSAMLSRADTDNGLWLVNDLADPANDYGVYIGSLAGSGVLPLSDAQYYLANVGFIRWTLPSSVQRTDEVRQFFTTRWSTWHDEFLTTHDIAMVLVHDRCPPAWSARDFPGVILGATDKWTLLQVGSDAADPTALPWVPSSSTQQRYGASACLPGQ